jgi:hypothetical protein
MAGRGGGGVGGVAQLGLSRGQAPAHIITGTCSGGCGSQAGAVFCTGFGRRRFGEGVSSAGGRGRGGGRRRVRRTAGDRERSWAALCRDEGTQRGTLVCWRSLEESLASVRR